MNLCKKLEKEVIYTCVWEDKRFLFLKNGRSGKILFPLFHELCTINMLPATSSPQLCNTSSKALTQGSSASHAFRLWPRFQPLENDSVMWGKQKANPKGSCMSKNESLKCNCARCTLWDETRSLQLRSLIHLCDNLWQQKVGFRSISVSAQRKSRIKTWCQTSTFAWCALTCRRRLK